MYVGGPVWALDWCPRSPERPETKVKCEYVAIAAHPPGSYYHKIGSPLVGRGVIQIWSILNVHKSEEETPSVIRKTNMETQLVNYLNDESSEPKRPRGRPRKNQEDDSTKVKKPKGRPRKKPVDEPGNMPIDVINCDDQDIQPLARQYSSSPCQQQIPRKKLDDDSKVVKKTRGRTRKEAINKPMNGAIDVSDCDDQDFQPLALEYPNTDHQGRSRKKQDNSSVQVKKPKGRARKIPIDEPTNKSTDGLSCDDEDVRPLAFAYPNISCRQGKSRKKQEDDPTEAKKSKGRSCKKSTDEPTNRQINGLECDGQFVEALALEYPNSTSQSQVTEKDSANIKGQRPQKQEVRKKNLSNKAVPACTLSDACPSLLNHTGDSCQNPQTNENSKDACTSDDGLQCGRLKRKRTAASKYDDYVCSSSVSQDEGQNHHTNDKSKQDATALGSVSDHVISNTLNPPLSILGDIALPRVMLCLAHNGKVVWDVKWKPWTASSDNCPHRMGYLAVLLGNGSIEVWDVPLPHIVKSIYSASHGEGSDPRFMKLEPVFRCSVPQSGQVKSIPLTVEWSYSQPHDYLLVGCHDGTVALWKFFTNGSAGDTRPLLCFSAETGPVRAITWAPAESGEASEHLILTAGHKGLKFWDLRDPFRPLWELRPAPGFIYSVEWVSRPSCVLLSYADGTIRLISLVKAAYDAAVYGEPSVRPQQQGMHIIDCSSFAIWSLQVSKITGMVAYCSADGTVSRFQLTSKAVEKDPSRNRVPHFVCGSVTEDASGLVINTPLPNTLTSKKPPKINANPRYLSGLLTMMSEKEKANDQQLTLRDGGPDAKSDSDDEETLATIRTKSKKCSSDTAKEPISKRGVDHKQVEKGRSNSVKQALVPKGDEGVTENGMERLPSKLVAMHRVRWNMNKGCERWLCSGGAAGIVRCQEVVLSDIDMVVAKRR
ncbi:General transcription factor 3C polypeptide 2 [Linum grandiflorum]